MAAGPDIERLRGCKRVNSSYEILTTNNHRRPSVSIQSDKKRGSPYVSSDMPANDEGIEAVREKLIFDLETEVDKIKKVILRGGEALSAPTAEAAEGITTKTEPWKLRTRRAGGNGKKTMVEERKTSCFDPIKSPPSGLTKMSRLVVPLSRQEILEDYMAMGRHIPRRPKKRLRVVQIKVDSIFPCSVFTEVNLEKYKVCH